MWRCEGSKEVISVNTGSESELSEGEVLVTEKTARTLLILRGILVVLLFLLVATVAEFVRGDDSSSTTTSTAIEEPRAEDLLSIAIELIDNAQYPEGIAVLERALSMDASNPLVHYNLGVAFQFSGELERAENAYSTALSLDNRMGSAYYNRGLARQDLGNLQGAGDDLRIAVAIQPDNAAAHLALGDVLIALGDVEEGEKAIETAKFLDPSIS